MKHKKATAYLQKKTDKLKKIKQVSLHNSYETYQSLTLQIESIYKRNVAKTLKW